MKKIFKKWYRRKKEKKNSVEDNYMALGNKLSLMKEHLTIHLIEHERICPAPVTSSPFDDKEIRELCDSIRRYGLLQPLAVRRVCSDGSSFGGMFTLISGSKRLEALKILGIHDIPCVICELPASSSLLASASSKIHTGSAEIFEIGAILRQIRDENCLSYEEIAQKMSLSKSEVRTCLLAESFDEEEKGICKALGFSTEVVENLSRIKDKVRRKGILRKLSSLLNRDFSKSSAVPPKTRDPLNLEEQSQSKNFLFTDMRVLYNTVENLVSSVRTAGIGASWRKQDLGDHFGILISVPKKIGGASSHENSLNHSAVRQNKTESLKSDSENAISSSFSHENFKEHPSSTPIPQQPVENSASLNENKQSVAVEKPADNNTLPNSDLSGFQADNFEKSTEIVEKSKSDTAKAIKAKETSSNGTTLAEKALKAVPSLLIADENPQIEAPFVSKSPKKRGRPRKTAVPKEEEPTNLKTDIAKVPSENGSETKKTGGASKTSKKSNDKMKKSDHFLIKTQEQQENTASNDKNGSSEAEKAESPSKSDWNSNLSFPNPSDAVMKENSEKKRSSDSSNVIEEDSHNPKKLLRETDHIKAFEDSNADSFEQLLEILRENRTSV